MNSEIYLDNNSTTQCDEEVLNVMLPYFKEKYANPNSIYSSGRKVREEISKARKSIAKLLNADENEIIFTSCATESNTSAIMNAIKNNQSKKHIITTKVEHASILECMKNLEFMGYHVTYLSVDEYGRLNLEELEKSIRKDTCLITVMLANNEIGNIYPIKEIGKIAEKYNILFHCDAVQAIGKIKVDVKELKVDTLSLAGHKIYAPKGVGVLYIKDGITFNTLIYGHQENSVRGGTENVPYIIGLGKAAELIIDDNFKSEEKIQELRTYMENQIKGNIEDVHIYGDLSNRIPNTSNIAFKGVKGNLLLSVLETQKMFISTGSACNSETALPSHVLIACNADLANYNPIRISLGKYNTKEEIDKFVEVLIFNVKKIRDMKKKRLK